MKDNAMNSPEGFTPENALESAEAADVVRAEGSGGVSAGKTTEAVAGIENAKESTVDKNQTEVPISEWQPRRTASGKGIGHLRGGFLIASERIRSKGGEDDIAFSDALRRFDDRNVGRVNTLLGLRNRAKGAFGRIFGGVSRSRRQGEVSESVQTDSTREDGSTISDPRTDGPLPPGYSAHYDANGSVPVETRRFRSNGGSGGEWDIDIPTPRADALVRDGMERDASEPVQAQAPDSAPVPTPEPPAPPAEPDKEPDIPPTELEAPVVEGTKKVEPMKGAEEAYRVFEKAGITPQDLLTPDQQADYDRITKQRKTDQLNHVDEQIAKIEAELAQVGTEKPGFQKTAEDKISERIKQEEITKKLDAQKAKKSELQAEGETLEITLEEAQKNCIEEMRKQQISQLEQDVTRMQSELENIGKAPEGSDFREHLNRGPEVKFDERRQADELRRQISTAQDRKMALENGVQPDSTSENLQAISQTDAYKELLGLQAKEFTKMFDTASPDVAILVQARETYLKNDDELGLKLDNLRNLKKLNEEAGVETNIDSLIKNIETQQEEVLKAFLDQTDSFRKKYYNWSFGNETATTSVELAYADAFDRMFNAYYGEEVVIEEEVSQAGAVEGGEGGGVTEAEQKNPKDMTLTELSASAVPDLIEIAKGGEGAEAARERPQELVKRKATSQETLDAAGEAVVTAAKDASPALAQAIGKMEEKADQEKDKEEKDKTVFGWAGIFLLALQLAAGTIDETGVLKEANINLSSLVEVANNIYAQEEGRIREAVEKGEMTEDEAEENIQALASSQTAASQLAQQQTVN